MSDSTVERWDHLQQIFAHALPLRGTARDKFLDQACAGEPSLRQQVEELLEASSDADDLLEPTGGRDAQLQHWENCLIRRVPERIGRFRIVRQIATGGMGAVYEAEQDEPRRQVALKLMRHGLSSETGLRRFQYEAQLLGRLQHPNIAQVHEAGTHQEAGEALPFYAMEYVVGARTITDYCREKVCDVRGRLRLFGDACHAVGYAHQKGIIHRDLKPGNIVVDNSGRVKVIDFGVARATGNELTQADRHTRTGDLVGTLQYMSPEQTLGDPEQIDTRCDVYSLGVVLYELLTHSLPYDVSCLNIIEAARTIREDRPSRLSKADAKLRGELETIAEKCLEKNADRRYTSASAVAEDIERYLKGEAVVATPPTMSYKLKVFLRNHRAWAVSSGIVSVVVIISCFVGATMHLRSQRDRNTAAEVATILSGMIESVDPAHQGESVPARTMLDQVAERIEGDVLRTQPLLEASLRLSLGMSYAAQSCLEDAEVHLRRSLELYEQQLGLGHQETWNAANELASVLLEHYNLDESRETTAVLQRVLAAQQQLLSPDDDKIMRTLRNLTTALSRQQRPHEGIDAAKKLYELQAEKLGEDHEETLWSLHGLACSHNRVGNYEISEELHAEIVERRKQTLGADHLDTLFGMRFLAWAKFQQGKVDEAEPLIQETLRKTRQIAGTDHSRTVDCLYVLGAVLMAKRNYAQAVEALKLVIENERKTKGSSHVAVGYSSNTLAIALRESGEFEEAEQVFRDALRLISQRQETHPEDMGMVQSELGECLVELGRLDEAERLLLKGYDAQHTRRSRGNQHTRKAVERLIRLYQVKEQPDDVSHWESILDEHTQSWDLSNH